jgi:hypothetical protein
MKEHLYTKFFAATLLLTAGPAVAQSTAPSGAATAPAATSPSTPLTQDTIAAIDKACLPLLRGAKPQAAASAGFRLQDGVWTMSANGQPKVELDPPDVANPHLCTLTITYRPGDGAPLSAALGAWANAQSPPLTSGETSRAVAGSPDGLTTSTWSGQTSGGGVESVVLSQEQPAAGADGSRQSTVLVSLGPA